MDLVVKKVEGGNETVYIPGYGLLLGCKGGKYIFSGKCFNRPTIVLVAAGLAILADILISCIPVYVMSNIS